MSVDEVQAEHDIHTLRTLVDDIALDWRAPNGNRVLKENRHLIENALDDLSRIVESIRETSQSYTVDLRTLETV